jgi:hypothetical protein
MDTRSRTAAKVTQQVTKQVTQQVTQQVTKQVTKQVTQQVMDMPVEKMCPCGGGQSCIVDRRWVGDWVHEDTVFTNAGLPIRKNCFSSFTTAQQKKLGIKF